MTEALDPARRATLELVCDTVVPSIAHAPDPHGLWATSARQLGVALAAEEALLNLPAVQRAGMMELLDILGEQGMEGMSQASREQSLMNMMLLGGAPAMVGVGGLVRLILFLTYGLPSLTEPGAPNPLWAAFGYPGPPGPAVAERTVRTATPDGDRLELDADVVIVGSGAGGGVIAGTLAQRGLSVVVLEGGSYRDEGAAAGLELPAYQEAYWRGGPQASADYNITLMAGAGLGGGTAINWNNSLRTRQWVRDEWAQAGLEDIGTEFDQHIDAVWDRLGVNDACSDLNGTHQKAKLGADRLGWKTSLVTRNVDPERYDPETSAFVGFGDISGQKQSTLRTYLQDASDAGAVIVANCAAERVLVEDGAAAGALGVWTDPADPSHTAEVVVRARHVVCAAGSLETPALLLRSGIGGPAVGRHLRLHPTAAVFGIYDDDLKAWWGAPQALLLDEFETGVDGDGYGFLVECSQYAPGLIGSSMPFTSAEAHKRTMEITPNVGVFVGLTRDHGSGTVTIDEDGQSVVQYALTDPIDIATMHRAMDAMVRMHEAAGAREISLLGVNPPVWRRGDDLEAFIARMQRMPLRFGGVTLFTAHQMGTARMGADPQTSVADPRGELHDTRGVWIGDASAFPTASGTNPMISVMALAHRTADAIALHAGVTDPDPVAA